MAPMNRPVNTDAATDNRHPLIHFKGEVVDINDKVETSRNNGKPYTMIVFSLANLQVIEAREPYTFPTTTVEIFELNIPGSAWEAWKNSVRKLGFSGDINQLIGKQTEWKYAEAILNQRNRETGKFENTVGACWQILAIEGVENTSPKLQEAILTLANGKSDQEFQVAFLADSELRKLTGYQDAVNGVINKTLLGGYVAAGMLTQDNGVYVKVPLPF